MSKVLVTGGAGFIGSHLCDYLLEKGYEVICVDNVCTGNKKNIEHLEKNEKFKFVQKDVSKDLDVENKVEYIFHLASPASPVDYQNIPIETMLVNSFGTYNALNLAMKNNARFLLASTSEVYGDPIHHPQKETDFGNVNCVGPRACYDEGKRFAEALTMSYRRKHNLHVRIVRIFNTYGPRMRLNDGRVIPNFLTQASNGKELTIYGKGTQTRSFCYISDLVEGLYKAMFVENLDGEVINLGNDSEITILDLAETVKKLVNPDMGISFKPLPQDDPVQRQPDILKAKKLLEWEPSVSLEQGLKRTLESMKQ